MRRGCFKWFLLAALTSLLGGVFLGGWLTARVFPFEHRDIIHREAAAHDLDPYLVAAVIREESRFRPEALSSKGAVGLMQLMPKTARWVADETGMSDFSEVNLYEPTINVSLGCWYLRHLLDCFDNSVPQALAAYNGGRGRVQRWLHEGTWSGSPDDIPDIPAEETRKFVRRVLFSHRLYREIYGRIDRWTGK